jgi:hypothetical protein
MQQHGDKVARRSRSIIFDTDAILKTPLDQIREEIKRNPLLKSDKEAQHNLYLYKLAII